MRKLLTQTEWLLVAVSRLCIYKRNGERGVEENRK